MKMTVLIFQCLILFSIGQQAIAQGAAPSSNIVFYDAARGDIIMDKVMVPQTSSCTYYETIGWYGRNGDGNGYGGIQDHPNGNCYIYSMWQPQTSTGAIAADYVGEGTSVAAFGGEGTGMRSMNFQIGWDLNEWLQIVSRNWQYSGHTFYALWIKRSSNGKWYHMITFSYPVANLNFASNNVVFVEDWLGTGQYIRKAYYKDYWKRNSYNVWIQPYSVYFSSNSGDTVRNGIYNESYNTGVENESYFIQVGGNTTHSFPGRTLNLPLLNQGSAPQLGGGKVNSVQATYSNNQVTVNWTICDTCNPQFSYKADIYSDTTAAPLYSTSDVRPHIRQTVMNTAALTPGIYYLKLSLKDIFDQQVPVADASFAVTPTGTGLEQLLDFPIGIRLMQNNPNPFNLSTTVKYELPRTLQVSLTVYDLLGRDVSVLVNERKDAGVHEVKFDASNLASGVYFYRLQAGDFVQTKRLILLK